MIDVSDGGANITTRFIGIYVDLSATNSGMAPCLAAWQQP